MGLSGPPAPAPLQSPLCCVRSGTLAPWGLLALPLSRSSGAGPQLQHGGCRPASPLWGSAPPQGAHGGYLGRGALPCADAWLHAAHPSCLEWGWWNAPEPELPPQGLLVPARPAHACQAIEAPPQLANVSGFVALVQRYNCSFDIKVSGGGVRWSPPETLVGRRSCSGYGLSPLPRDRGRPWRWGWSPGPELALPPSGPGFLSCRSAAHPEGSCTPWSRARLGLPVTGTSWPGCRAQRLVGEAPLGKDQAVPPELLTEPALGVQEHSGEQSLQRDPWLGNPASATDRPSPSRPGPPAAAWHRSVGGRGLRWGKGGRLEASGAVAPPQGGVLAWQQWL